MQITEENCKQFLWEYAYENYSDEFKRAVDDCPYPTDDLDDEFAFKEIMEWFILERVQPTTGKTILREFVEKFVTDPDLKKKMLQMEKVFSGEFTVENVQGDYALIMNNETGKSYRIKIFKKIKRFFKAGRTFIGRIHPWGDIYWTAGIIRFKLDEEERMARLGLVSAKMLKNWYERDRIKKAESILVHENSTVSSIVNKYPAQWVDGLGHLLPL